jgi:hypothetical protein
MTKLPIYQLLSSFPGVHRFQFLVYQLPRKLPKYRTFEVVTKPAYKRNHFVSPYLKYELKLCTSTVLWNDNKAMKWNKVWIRGVAKMRLANRFMASLIVDNISSKAGESLNSRHRKSIQNTTSRCSELGKETVVESIFFDSCMSL